MTEQLSENSGASRPSGGDRAHARDHSWLAAVYHALRNLTSVSVERRKEVLVETQEGSLPTPIYYVLLGLSELIAGFALMINSDATLIGANVVAPLMTPIFGVSLGLMRSDLRLLRNALLAEFGGALLGVALCFVLGLLPFAFEPSATLLAQTKPTLIDLAVAALAGFAGGLAMIDERVSPALPGVAIATALNPPIAAIGLCLAYGAYDAAWGATILFLANVLAIMAVAAALFLVAGFVTREEIGSVRGLARRFLPAAIGLAAVTFLLTGYLLAMVRDLRTTRTVNGVMSTELAHEPGTALVGIDTVRRDGRLDVLTTVRTPRVLSPDHVAAMQDKLSTALGTPVRLFLRCGVTSDVIAAGSRDLSPFVGLASTENQPTMSAETLLLQEAEQIAREAVSARPDISLKDVELLSLATGPVLVFSIETPRDPSPATVQQFEERLQQRLDRPDVRVVARTTESSDTTTKGRILFGEAHFGDLDREDEKTQERIEESVRTSLQQLPDVFVSAVDAIVRDEGWTVRAEASAPKALTPQEIQAAEQAAAKDSGQRVSLFVRTRVDLMVSSSGYQPLGAPVAGPAAAATEPAVPPAAH
ncbi:MAG TPA: DUF389 domain-containing protein [Candidatus Binatia bacterium]